MSGTATTLQPLGFDALEGWADDDHTAALAAFRRGAAVLAEHPPKARSLGLDADALADTLRRAVALPPTVSKDSARRFFEEHFTPHLVEPNEGNTHFTGYYEPEIAASRTRSPRHTVPFLARPRDLVEVEPSTVPGLEPDLRFARCVDGVYTPYPDRAAIMAGTLKGRGLEIAFVEDPVDAFFAHIQGSARLRLTDGATLRITYAAKSGHAYTPIGRVMRDRGLLPADDVTMQSIRAWLAANPQARDDILATNRSYIFFREAHVENPQDGPVAAAKVPLTAGRSLAVDRLLHSFHAPVWIGTQLPSEDTFSRLMIAQDTGSAIVGPARGDIFFGSGDVAGELAGAMNAGGSFVLFLPRVAGGRGS